MFSFILATMLVAAAPPSNPTPEVLLRQMDDDSWHTREKATKQMIELCIKDKAAFEKAKKAMTDADTSLEVRSRLKWVMGAFYRPMWTAKAPIWSLPKELRYVKDKDVAKEYYEKAKKEGDFNDDDSKYFNHDQIMVYATQLYIKDRLTEFTDRSKVEELTTKLNKSWKEEDEMVRKYIEETYYCGSVQQDKPPAAIEERLDFLKKKLQTGEDKWTYNIDSSKCVTPASEYFYGGDG